MTEDRVLPPPPSSAPRIGSKENDFWAGLFLDLSVRVEWLGQALDAVPKEDASAPALVRLRAYARCLQELQSALQRVHAQRADPQLKPLFSLEGALAGFLSRLYGWCEEMGEDFERMAVALRRKEPTSTVFSHQAVNGSYAQFGALIAAMRSANEIARELHADDDQEAWRAFDESIEELIWAVEWIHMALARRPGD
jgi:hypothetical protein